MLGNVPESINNWITCFNNNTSEEERATNEVAYACAAVDVRTGGIIEGYNTTLVIQARQGSQNAGTRKEVGKWGGALAVAISAALWATMV